MRDERTRGVKRQRRDEAATEEGGVPSSVARNDTSIDDSFWRLEKRELQLNGCVCAAAQRCRGGGRTSFCSSPASQRGGRCS